MSLEDMLAFVILTAITLGILYFITGKFIELKVIKRELVQSRDTVDMLQFLLTSSDLLVKGDGGRARLLLNETIFLEPVEKAEQNVHRTFEGFGINFMDYDYQLEIFSDAFLSTKLYDYSFIFFDSNSDCYREAYFSVVRDSSALLCRENSNYFCKPVQVRLKSAETPISQLVSWISKLCYSAQRRFEKLIILNISEIRPCVTEAKECGIRVDQTNKLICFYLVNGARICKNYYCDKELEIITWAPEEECGNVTISKTYDKILVQGPYLWSK